MKFSDFEFKPDNHFVAMEYCWLILNRTFLILETEKELIGIKVRGPIGVETHDPAIEIFQLAVKGDLQNPYSYVRMKYINKIKDVDLLSSEFLNADRSNFRILRTDILSANHDKRKKWGMGYYPHDGKVYVTTLDKREREFIILGNQSGEEISKRLTWKRVS